MRSYQQARTMRRQMKRGRGNMYFFAGHHSHRRCLIYLPRAGRRLDGVVVKVTEHIWRKGTQVLHSLRPRPAFATRLNLAHFLRVFLGGRPRGSTSSSEPGMAATSSEPGMAATSSRAGSNSQVRRRGSPGRSGISG